MNPTISRLFRVTASDRARTFDGHHPDDEETSWGPFDGHIEDTDEVERKRFLSKSGNPRFVEPRLRSKGPRVSLTQIPGEEGPTHVIVFSRDDPNEFEVRPYRSSIRSWHSDEAAKALAAGNARRRRFVDIS